MFNVFGPRVDVAPLIAQGARVIDVRSASEFAQGHAKHSENIPLDTLPGHMEEIKQSNKPIILVCASGARSGVALSMLKAVGVEAYNGGAWTTVVK